MFRTGVNLQLRQLLTSEPALREHPLHRRAQDFFGPALKLLAKRAAAEAAGIPRVPVVALLVELVTGDLNLLGIHDDDEVAGVDMRGVLRLARATERVGDARREPAERLALGVADVPLRRELPGV